MIKTKNSLLTNVNNPKIFFDILGSIPNEVYLKKILILLDKKKEIDYFLLASKAIKNNYEVFKLQMLLDKLVFISILNVNTLLDLYKTLSSLHYEYITFNITENISKNFSLFSKDLYLEMSKNTEEYMITHLSILFETVINNEKYSHIKDLLDNNNLFLVRSSIESISTLILSLKQAKEILNIFITLKKKNNIKLDKNIILASDKLKNKFYIFEDLLISYSSSDSSEIKYSISKVLLLNKAKDLNKDWFRECLFSLGNLNSYNKEILRNISFILNNILVEKNEYKIIIEFLELASSKYKIENEFPEKELSLFIRNFPLKHKDLFESFIQEINDSNNTALIKISKYF